MWGLTLTLVLFACGVSSLCDVCKLLSATWQIVLIKIESQVPTDTHASGARVPHFGSVKLTLNSWGYKLRRIQAGAAGVDENPSVGASPLCCWAVWAQVGVSRKLIQLQNIHTVQQTLGLGMWKFRRGKRTGLGGCRTAQFTAAVTCENKQKRAPYHCSVWLAELVGWFCFPFLLREPGLEASELSGSASCTGRLEWEIPFSLMFCLVFWSFFYRRPKFGALHTIFAPAFF